MNDKMIVTRRGNIVGDPQDVAGWYFKEDPEGLWLEYGVDGHDGVAYSVFQFEDGRLCETGHLIFEAIRDMKAPPPPPVRMSIPPVSEEVTRRNMGPFPAWGHGWGEGYQAGYRAGLNPQAQAKNIVLQGRATMPVWFFIAERVEQTQHNDMPVYATLDPIQPYRPMAPLIKMLEEALDATRNEVAMAGRVCVSVHALEEMLEYAEGGPVRG